MPMCERFGVIAALLVVSAARLALAGPYDEQRMRAAQDCGAIDPGAYQSGLLFNPDGYRSYYERSQCFQEAAIRFRDAALCESVRRRFSLFSSSWGYSESRCRELVDEGVRADRAAIDGLREAYQRQRVRLVDFRIERNGNGRDFDVIPRFDGVAGHGYRLTLALRRDTHDAPVLVHDDGYFLEGTESNLRIFLPVREIRARYPAFAPDVPYSITATLELSIGTGSQSGLWSDAFIEQEFPAASRRQQLTHQVTFAALTYSPEPLH